MNNTLPEGFTPLEPAPQIQPVARRRRRRRSIVPPGKGDRALFIGEIAERLIPGFDYFLFSLLAGIILALGILLDSPAIYVLAALLCPFMAPVIGLGFASAVGSVRFLVQSLGSLLIGSGLVFGAGALGGWISKLLPDLTFNQALQRMQFSIPDFVLLTIGAVMAIYLTVRVPKQRSLVASVALAYEIYIPIGVAGFGLTSGISGLTMESLKVAGIHTAWVIVIGTLLLIILKLRPFNFFGYLLTVIILGGALYALVVTSAFGSAIQKQIAPYVFTSSSAPSELPPEAATATRSPISIFQQSTPTISTPTNTLVPTRTPTLTITPQPTPVWAKVNSPSSTGVVVREQPTFSSKYIASLLNGSLVQVLPETVFADNNYWVHIITNDGKEGWIVRGLLVTATPAPEW